MKRLKTEELFSGTGSFSKVAKEKGHSIFRVDYDLDFECEYHANLMNEFEYKLLPQEIDVLWCSPPCDSFSVASIGKHWNKNHTPKTEQAKQSLKLLKILIKQISLMLKKNNNLIFFIENPRGKMRKIINKYFILYNLEVKRHTVTYCQYGDSRMKPTDIWSNCKEWKSRPMCKNGDSCHIPAPRGSKTGTQGLKGSILRGVIPRDLFIEIFKVIENKIK